MINQSTETKHKNNQHSQRAPQQHRPQRPKNVFFFLLCQCILAQEYLPLDIPHCAKAQQNISLILFAWIAGHCPLLQCNGHQRRSSCQKHGMASQNFPEWRTIRDSSIWVQDHWDSRGMWKSEGKYPYTPHHLWWRRMANYHFGSSQPPRQPLKIYWPFCSELWVHRGVHWHSETPSGMCHAGKWSITTSRSATLMAHFSCRFIHLTLSILLSKCSSHCCNTSLSPFWNDQYCSSPMFLNTGSKMTVLCACMTLIDGNVPFKSLCCCSSFKYCFVESGISQFGYNLFKGGCVHVVSILYPTLLKLILEIWCTMDPGATLAPPPGRFVFNTGGRASNDPPPGLWICCRCPVG